MIIRYLDPWGKADSCLPGSFTYACDGVKKAVGSPNQQPLQALTLPIGPKVVPFWGSYLEFYKVIPKRNYFGAFG